MGCGSSSASTTPVATSPVPNGSAAATTRQSRESEKPAPRDPVRADERTDRQKEQECVKLNVKDDAALRTLTLDRRDDHVDRNKSADDYSKEAENEKLGTKSEKDETDGVGDIQKKEDGVGHTHAAEESEGKDGVVVMVTTENEAVPAQAEKDKQGEGRNGEQTSEKKGDESNKVETAEGKGTAEGCHITEATMDHFMSLEADIDRLTKDDVVSQLKTAEERLESVTQSLADSDDRLKVLQAKTAQEFQDVVRLKGASLQGLVVHNYEQQLSKEEDEYYAALNEQNLEEHKKKHLEEQYEKTSHHVAMLRSQVDELIKRQEEREDLLSEIFDGDYGSEKEQELELKVNLFVDKHGQVKTAHFRWSNARVLVGHAIKQLHHAITKWVDMRRIHPANRQLLYRVATEARNNLSASSQNVYSAHQYIPSPLEVPYCNSTDMNKLNVAIARLYHDMLYPVSHRAAYDLYVQIYHRMCLFHQWISHVVTSNIATQLASLTKKLNKKRKKLVEERKRIMLCMIKGEGSPETTEDADDSDDETEDKDELSASSEDSSNDHLNPDGGPTEADTISVSSQNVLDEQQVSNSDVENDAADIPNFQPIPLSELAPPPSQDQVFGNVDELMKQHEDELEEFNKARERSKARTEQDLKEKLRQRRSKKRKQQLQAIEEQMVKVNGEES